MATPAIILTITTIAKILSYVSGHLTHRELPKDEVRPGLQSDEMNTSYPSPLAINVFIVMVKLSGET